MNEAAILAARRNLKEISKEEIADALERIVAGPEKKGAVMSEKKKKLVAYHEVSHSLLTCLAHYIQALLRHSSIHAVEPAKCDACESPWQGFQGWYAISGLQVTSCFLV